MMIAGSVVFVLGLAPQVDPAAAHAREAGHARVPLARTIARDAAIRGAVAAQNLKGETPEQIKRKDAAWVANPRDPMRQAVVQAPCSARLRDLVKDDGLVVEAFVMDAQGAVVCSVAETSDYWQGDEPKWQRTFVEGREAFVEDPAFDASSGTYAIQLSVPVSEETRRIGAVTLTLTVPGRPASPPPASAPHAR